MGGGGGGKLSRPVYLAAHPPGYQNKISFAKSTYFFLSEYENVLIINIRVSTSSGNHGKPGKPLKRLHAWKNQHEKT